MKKRENVEGNVLEALLYKMHMFVNLEECFLGLNLIDRKSTCGSI